MTIDNTRDPRGQLQVTDDDRPACGDEHWLGHTCQAEQGHKGRCRYYEDGGRYEWTKPGAPWQMVVLVRPEGEP